MEQLKERHGYLLDALARLNESVEDAEKVRADDRKWRMARDSMIKRFEFTIELFWKYLKKRLDKVEGVSSMGPRSVIREACALTWIEANDAEIFLQMLQDRNLTSHIYKEEIADQIGGKIPAHYKLMKQYTDKLTPETT